MSFSYRNQSIDLQSKSIDWFLYEKDIGRERVNPNMFNNKTAMRLQCVGFLTTHLK